MKKMLLIASAALMLLPLTAAARVGVFVGSGFAPMGWYGYGYGPFYRPYPYGAYYGVPNAGQVKLETKVKDAQVFVDGAYAGTSGKLKTMWMRPGAYTIEMRAPDTRNSRRRSTWWPERRYMWSRGSSRQPGSSLA